jgi:hypothetical protein
MVGAKPQRVSCAAKAWCGTRRVRLALRHALVSLLSLVLLAGVVRSGAAYVYCATMNEIVSDACCDLRVRAREDGRAEIASRSECCKVHALGSVPGASPNVTRGTVVDPPALAVQVVQPTDSFRMSPRLLVQPVHEPPHTGPPKPSDIPRRLRVFLI